MGNYAHNFMNAVMAAGHKIALCLALLLVSVFSLRAGDNGTRVKILFPFDSDSVKVNYSNNAAQLSLLDKIAQDATVSGSIVITSYASPEGNWDYNCALAARRANSLKRFLQKNYPSLAQNIVVKPGAEAWERLREAVASDARLSESTRENVLNIIDGTQAPDVKEQELSALPEYKKLYSNYFRSLRYAEIELRIENSQPAAAVADCDFSGYVVYYSLSEVFIRPQYMGNAQSLKEIRSILSQPENRDRQIVIEGAASPEGSEKANMALSQRRAQNLADELIAQFPDMKDRIVLRPLGENWAGLRCAVAACNSLTDEDRADVFSIIDSRETPARKEALLKSLACYSIVVSECFPYLRFARFAGFEEKVEEPIEEVVEEPVIEVVEEPVIEVVEEIVEEEPQIVEEVPQKVSVPLFALTTNTLYTAAGSIATGFHAIPVNGGFEIPIGQHWSAYGDYLVTTPWRAWNSNGECAELMHWGVGAKWYPGGSFKRPFSAKPNRQVLDGWYAYAGVGMGYYDFQHNGNGYQGEEILASVGIGYGLTLGKHWSLDFGLGVGPMFTYYRYYEGRSNNQHLMYQYKGTFQYLGITDVKVSLRYLFYYNKKNNTVR